MYKMKCYNQHFWCNISTYIVDCELTFGQPFLDHSIHAYIIANKGWISIFPMWYHDLKTLIIHLRFLSETLISSPRGANSWINAPPPHSLPPKNHYYTPMLNIQRRAAGRCQNATTKHQALEAEQRARLLIPPPHVHPFFFAEEGFCPRLSSASLYDVGWRVTGQYWRIT